MVTPAMWLVGAASPVFIPSHPDTSSMSRHFIQCPQKSGWGETKAGPSCSACRARKPASPPALQEGPGEDSSLHSGHTGLGVG